jgi:hypothetical protein
VKATLLAHAVAPLADVITAMAAQVAKIARQLPALAAVIAVAAQTALAARAVAIAQKSPIANAVVIPVDAAKIHPAQALNNAPPAVNVAALSVPAAVIPLAPLNAIHPAHVTPHNGSPVHAHHLVIQTNATRHLSAAVPMLEMGVRAPQRMTVKAIVPDANAAVAPAVAPVATFVKLMNAKCQLVNALSK